MLNNNDILYIQDMIENIRSTINEYEDDIIPYSVEDNILGQVNSIQEELETLK